MTGQPIIENKGNHLSALKPTKLIYNNEGHIILEYDQFKAGVRPANKVGSSVNPLGGNAQVKAMN